MDYKNDPLWKQAVAMHVEAMENAIGYMDRVRFEQRHEDIANVVLAYFNDKPAKEMLLFAEALKKTAQGYSNHVVYKYNSSAERAQELMEESEHNLMFLWEKMNCDLKKDTDSGKEDKKKLNVFERILNHCVLFLKSK